MTCCWCWRSTGKGRSPGRSTSSGGRRLFGRYWGCTEHHPCLHFELCYYQAIDYAIAHGLRVEAGAQGEHKLARGYMPVVTHSLHWIADPGFRRGDCALSGARSAGD